MQMIHCKLCLVMTIGIHKIVSTTEGLGITFALDVSWQQQHFD